MFIIPHVKIVSCDWLTKVGNSSCPPAKCPPAKRPPFSLDLLADIVVFIDILPNWGLFGIIKQICHASVGILMKCLPSGGWFSLWLRPRENHPPSGRHSIRIPTLAWHICIIQYTPGSTLPLTLIPAVVAPGVLYPPFCALAVLVLADGRERHGVRHQRLAVDQTLRLAHVQYRCAKHKIIIKPGSQENIGCARDKFIIQSNLEIQKIKIP